MFVCNCHGVTEKQLETIVRSGANSLGEIQGECSAGGDCGSCVDQIEACIERIKSSQSASKAASGTK